MTETTAGDLFRGREGSGSPIPGAEGDLADVTAEELAALDEAGQDLFIPGRGEASRDPEDGAALRDRETGEVTDSLDPGALQDAAGDLADRLAETADAAGSGSSSGGGAGGGDPAAAFDPESIDSLTTGGMGPSWLSGAALAAAVVSVVVAIAAALGGGRSDD